MNHVKLNNSKTKKLYIDTIVERVKKLILSQNKNVGFKKGFFLFVISSEF